MSLILEALKKSERQRRLGESPSLGSPIMAVHRRRSLLPALIVLILLGLLALWWFRREAGTTGAEPAAPSVLATAPAPKVPDATTFNDGPLPPPPPPAAVPRELAQGNAASREPRSKVPPDATGAMNTGPGERVKAGDGRASTAQLPKPDRRSSLDEAAQAAAMAGADDALNEQRAAAAAMAQAAAAANDNPGAARVPASVASAPETSSPAAPAAAATSTGAAVTLIWELPYATRRELPEIKLSMHVYADQPTQRFVIINGERQVEGDEVGNLELIEIRRDGVVFDFEGSRFLYPRGGR